MFKDRMMRINFDISVNFCKYTGTYKKLTVFLQCQRKGHTLLLATRYSPVLFPGLLYRTNTFVKFVLLVNNLSITAISFFKKSIEF